MRPDLDRYRPRHISLVHGILAVGAVSAAAIFTLPRPTETQSPQTGALRSQPLAEPIPTITKVENLSVKENSFKHLRQSLEARYAGSNIRLQFRENSSGAGRIETNEGRKPRLLPTRERNAEYTTFPSDQIPENQLEWDHEIVATKDGVQEIYGVRTLLLWPDSPDMVVTVLHLIEVSSIAGLQETHITRFPKTK